MKGFTLIELMIVIAIIGILAADFQACQHALPAYQEHTLKQNGGANATTEFISPIGIHRDAPAQQEHKQTPSTELL